MTMEATLAYWLRWPSVENFLNTYSWGWPTCEVFHFFGLILLFGAVGTYDLRLIGIGKGLPPSLLKRLLPWGVLGFVLCVATGFVFVTGIVSNVGVHPIVVLKTNIYLQFKLGLIALAGLNMLLFYVTGMGRLTDALGPMDDAPPLARALGATSLVLWLGVIYFGRLIPWAL
jgi:hypothetical protein